MDTIGAATKSPFFSHEERENYMLVLVFKKGVSGDALPRPGTVLRDGSLRHYVVGSIGGKDGSVRVYLAWSLVQYLTGADYLLGKHIAAS